MNKVVISRCYGGYGISDEAMALYERKKPGSVINADESLIYLCRYEWNHQKHEHMDHDGPPRHDPTLIEVIEELGVEKASGRHAELHICELSSDKYRIHEYDGYETVYTPEDDKKLYIDIPQPKSIGRELQKLRSKNKTTKYNKV